MIPCNNRSMHDAPRSVVMVSTCLMTYVVVLNSGSVLQFDPLLHRYSVRLLGHFLSFSPSLVPRAFFPRFWMFFYWNWNNLVKMQSKCRQNRQNSIKIQSKFRQNSGKMGIEFLSQSRIRFFYLFIPSCYQGRLNLVSASLMTYAVVPNPKLTGFSWPSFAWVSRLEKQFATPILPLGNGGGEREKDWLSTFFPGSLMESSIPITFLLPFLEKGCW